MGVENAYQRCQSSYIKFLKWLLILSLILPVKIQAHVPINEYNQAYLLAAAPENIGHAPSGEIVERLAQEYEVTQAKLRVKREGNVSYYERQCVTWAKTITGNWSTWGDGGRLLSPNSDGQKGDVIIFKGRWVKNSVGKLVWQGHVGVITAKIGDIRLYTDRNSDNNGLIRYNVEIAIDDSRIWKFHKF